MAKSLKKDKGPIIMAEGNVTITSVEAQPSEASPGQTVFLIVNGQNMGDEDNCFFNIIDQDDGSLVARRDIVLGNGGFSVVPPSLTMPNKDWHLIVEGGHEGVEAEITGGHWKIYGGDYTEGKLVVYRGEELRLRAQITNLTDETRTFEAQIDCVHRATGIQWGPGLFETDPILPGDYDWDSASGYYTIGSLEPSGDHDVVVRVFPLGPSAGYEIVRTFENKIEIRD